MTEDAKTETTPATTSGKTTKTKAVTTRTKGGGVPAKTGSKTIQLKLGHNTVLDIITPSVSSMLVKPDDTTGLAVSTLLARCVVPVRMGVFNVPSKLLEKANKKAEDREEMLSIEIARVKQEITRFTMQMASPSASIMAEDIIMTYTAEGIANSKVYVDEFMKIVNSFCVSLKNIEKQNFSYRTHLRQKTLGMQGITINPMAMTIPIQDFVMNLNKIATGDEGWRILAVVKSIGRISQFLDDPTVMGLFGAKSKLEMLNALEYRISASDIALHGTLEKLVEKVIEIDSKGTIDNTEIGTLFMLCQEITDALNPIT